MSDAERAIGHVTIIDDVGVQQYEIDVGRQLEYPESAMKRADWQVALAELLAEEAMLRDRLSRVERARKALAALHDAPDVRVTGAITSTPKLTYTQAVLRVLREADGPLTIQQILVHLAEHGHGITTTHPYRTLYQAMRTHPKLFANFHGQWRLRKEAESSADEIVWPEGELPDQAIEYGE